MRSNDAPFDSTEQMSAAMEASPPVSLPDQIACIRRELGMRSRVYQRWVATEKMTAKKADYEIAAMRAVLETLEDVQAKGRLL